MPYRKGEIMGDRPIDAILRGVEAWHEWRGRNAAIRAPDLSGTDLSGMNLSKANFSQVSFVRANLSEANLSGADLTGGHLSGVLLSGAKLTGTNLSGARLFVLRPDLRNTNLSETISLTQEQIEQARGNEQTELPEHLKPPASWSQSSHD